MPASRNPLAGTRPCGLDFIHMVPPVMTMSTRDSGYAVAILARRLERGRMSVTADIERLVVMQYQAWKRAREGLRGGN
jgi:hypothetical protein